MLAALTEGPAYLARSPKNFAVVCIEHAQAPYVAAQSSESNAGFKWKVLFPFDNHLVMRCSSSFRLFVSGCERAYQLLRIMDLPARNVVDILYPRMYNILKMESEDGEEFPLDNVIVIESCLCDYM